MAVTPETAPRPDLSIRARAIDGAALARVTGSGHPKQERLCNEYIERYHYLGYGVPLGAPIKYFVCMHRQPMACLAFSGAAWRVEARDRWIGWSEAQRQRNLIYAGSHTRFFILPWIQSAHRASRVVSLVARRRPQDWQRRYGYRPRLLETLVPSERDRGTCYRAASWIAVSGTKGRGRMDCHFAAAGTKKTLLLYPLVKEAARQLRAR